MTKSSSFQKMLNQYQGNLPDISDTNYTSELDYTLTEEVNKEIDNLKTDFANRTEDAIAMATRAADSKQKLLTDLAGLVKPAKELHDYWKAKDLAKAQYDHVHKSNLKLAKIKSELDIAKGGLEKGRGLRKDSTIQEYMGNVEDEKGAAIYDELDKLGYLERDAKGKITGISNEGNAWIYKNLRSKEDAEGVDILSEEQKLNNRKLVNQHLKEEFEAREDQLDLQERIAFIKKNRATADELTARELQWQIVEDFDAIFPSLLRVKKQLDGMDRPMSYMDATSKDATAEDAAFASVLLRDALADYSAFNQDYVDKIGEKRYRDEVFPDLYKQAQATHKKFMGIALDTARSDNRDANAKAFAATFKREGIDSIIGSSGSVSIYERTLDGRKDNGMGFAKSQNLILHGLKQGYLTGRQVKDIIDDPFPARGGGTTTLEELKPEFYNAVSIAAENDIQEELKRDKAETSNDILQQTANIQDQAKEQNWSTNQIKAEAMKTWTELAKKHNLSPANSAFAELISLANYGQTRADRSSNALLTLQGQEARGELLSTELIAKLPQELQQAWKDKAAILGSEGLTTKELEDADTEFVETIKDYKQFGTIDQRLGPRMRLARSRMLGLYNATYQQLMISDNREDTLAAKQDNKLKAMDIVKKAFYTIRDKNPENHNEVIWGDNNVPKYRVSVANEAQLTQYLNTTEKPADNPLYWDSREEQAILTSLIADEKGEPISGWWTDKAKYFPNMTGRELFKYRTEATADLREGEIGDINIEDKYQLRTLSLQPNPAKPAQMILLPDKTEGMLEELQVLNADYNSTFRVPGKVPEFDPSQMTIGELLQLRIDNYGNWNDDIGLGIYDIQMKELVEILETPGVVERLGGADAIFDETMQKELMKIKIQLKGNKAGSTKSFNNSYRKPNQITNEEQVAYNGIVSGAYGEELANDPFRGLNTLTPGVAKVALEDVMAYV